MPELCKNILRGDSIQVSGYEDNWACCHMDKCILRFNIQISTVQKIPGVHWDTIKRMHKELMDEAIASRQKELRKEGYKPKHLAVDEFALHKGHRYATCVMDLDTGDVLWVGKGRTKADFSIFFQEMDMDHLSEVEAAAMDMNAHTMPW